VIDGGTMKDSENKVDIVKIAADEMLKGSKMLGEHCKVCGFPLFQDKKGNKYCVLCSTVKESEKIEGKKEEKKDGAPLYSGGDYRGIVDKKIEYLFKRLEGEYDVARIVEITEAIKVLLKLKSKLE